MNGHPQSNRVGETDPGGYPDAAEYFKNTASTFLERLPYE